MKVTRKAAGTIAVAAALLTGVSAVQGSEVELVINGKSYAVTFDRHPGTASLMSRLPLTLRFEDYGNVERIAYLSDKLDVKGAPLETTPSRGDITYYVSWGNIAVFTGDFRRSPGLMPLGKLSEEALTAIRNSGESPVILRNKK